ncbi:MAG: hypothetical protein CM1200mP1_12840 [Candidatus Neomarinimicrobiota bacterium]|nr:MAG: hypothetical protein CM1200mP1_12840 [Candidatus Neomarinimicrobiota bacterium]
MITNSPLGLFIVKCDNISETLPLITSSYFLLNSRPTAAGLSQYILEYPLKSFEVYLGFHKKL